MSSPSTSSILTKFGRILTGLRFPSVLFGSSPKQESIPTNMSQSRSVILNWPKPSELLIMEAQQLEALHKGKLLLMGDKGVFMAMALKRIEILQALINNYNDEWAGNSVELILKATPDLMVDQPILPFPTEPSPVTG